MFLVLGEQRKRNFTNIVLSYPRQIIKYMLPAFLLFFFSFAIQPIRDLNIKSIYICFLFKKFTYHSLCVKSSDSVPVYNLSPFPWCISSLKIRKTLSSNIHFFLGCDWHLFCSFGFWNSKWDTQKCILMGNMPCSCQSPQMVKEAAVAFPSPIIWASDKRQMDPLCRTDEATGSTGSL